MTTAHIIETIVEIIAIVLTAFAVYNSDKLSAFEKKLKKVIRYYYRRYKKLRALDKMRQERAFYLKVDNSPKIDETVSSGGIITDSLYAHEDIVRVKAG